MMQDNGGENIVAKSDFEFLLPLRVRYAEIDAQGVVFNAHYLTYFDTAITEFFRFKNVDYKNFVASGETDFHLVKALVNYEAPIHFDDEIEVGVRVDRVGNSSLSFALEIFPRGGDARLSSGEIVWVNTNQRTHRTERVPDRLREMLLPHC